MSKVYVGSIGSSSLNLKKDIMNLLSSDYDVIDCNNNEEDEISAPKCVGLAVSEDLNSFGIVLCGNGFGASKEASVSESLTVINCINLSQVKSGKKVNNAQILALGARMVSKDIAYELVQEFLKRD